MAPSTSNVHFLPVTGSRLVGILLLGLCGVTSANEASVVNTVLAFQRNSGGWPKNYDRKRNLNRREQQELLEQRSQRDTTIDNGATSVSDTHLTLPTKA